MGKTISPVSVAKDLGVYIDQYLTYDVHVTKTVPSYMNQLVQIDNNYSPKVEVLFFCPSDNPVAH